MAKTVRLATVLLGAFSASSVQAEMMDIGLHVQDRQASGLAWRGSAIPQIMKGPLMFGQLHSTAPSPILCVVAAGQRLACYNAVQGTLRSPCPLSYDCTFEDVRLPPDRVLGLLFLTHGMVNMGLIDAVTVTRTQLTRRDPDVAAMDGMLREVAAQLAPPDPTEAARRSRRWPIVTIQQCDLPCDLAQSKVKIVPAD